MPYKAAVIALDEDQWKDLKDLMDMGCEHMEAEDEDPAYREQLLRTWSRVRGQLETYGVQV